MIKTMWPKAHTVTQSSNLCATQMSVLEQLCERKFSTWVAYGHPGARAEEAEVAEEVN